MTLYQNTKDLSSGVYAMYLRKSRADLEAESKGEFETLSRHFEMLNDYAQKNGLRIVKVYRELVSGDSIDSRPEVQKLLEEVKQGLYDGVLVTEISRLARGRTTDQGRIADIFRESGTLIITPTKIYDPSDEADETFFDFELFLARQEYKFIRKRMKAGKQAALLQGKYVYANLPIGYERLKKHVIVPSKDAPYIKEAFERFANGEGCSSLCRWLRVVCPSRAWDSSTFYFMLKSPMYYGYMWVDVDGEKRLVKGDWKPIITEELASRALAKLGNVHVRNDLELRNAFSGLIKCERCGRSFVYIEHGQGYITHASGIKRKGCTCAGIKYDVLSPLLIDAITDSLPKVEESVQGNKEAVKKAYNRLNERLKEAERARERIFDHFDAGAYTLDEFKARREKWDKEIALIRKEMQSLRVTPARMVCTDDLIEKLKTGSPKEQNDILRGLIEKITYWRDKGKEPVIKIYPKVL